MKSDANNEWTLFVYDTALGIWHKEDALQVDQFCNCRNELYFIEHNSKAIKTITGTGIKDLPPIEWEAVTGVFGMSMIDNKYISRITLRLSLQLGSRIIIYIQYNSEDTWEHVATLTGTTLKSFTTPIRPRRCDHFKMRFVGVGEAKIYSISKTIEQGSEI